VRCAHHRGAPICRVGAVAFATVAISVVLPLCVCLVDCLNLCCWGERPSERCNRFSIRRKLADAGARTGPAVHRAKMHCFRPSRSGMASASGHMRSTYRIANQSPGNRSVFAAVAGLPARLAGVAQVGPEDPSQQPDTPRSPHDPDRNRMMRERKFIRNSILPRI